MSVLYADTNRNKFKQFSLIENYFLKKFKIYETHIL